MKTRQRVGAATLIVLATAGLTGCLKMDMQLNLQSDDTIDGSLVFAVSQELADLMQTSGETMAQEMQDGMVGLDGGDVTSEPYDDGTFVGSTTTFEGEPLNAFSGENATAASESTGDENITIVREGDEFVVSGAFDLSVEGMDVGSTPDPESAAMMEGMDIRIAITFPGEVTDYSDTGELDGTTVTWTPKYGERVEITARGSAVEGQGNITGGGDDTSNGSAGDSSASEKDGFPVVPVAIGAGVLLLLGLVLFFVLRSRKGGQQATAGAYGYQQPPQGYAGPTPQGGYPAPPQGGYPAPPQGGYTPPAPGAPPTQQPPTQPYQ